LERELIEEFLRARGREGSKLAELPEQDRHALLKEASIYASARLTEVESRSHYVDELRTAGPGSSGRRRGT
jgi:hypothetical protein